RRACCPRRASIRSVSWNLRCPDPRGSADAHQVRHLVDHSAHRRRVFQLAGLVQLLQAQAQHGRLVRTAGADGAANQRDLDRLVAHRSLRAPARDRRLAAAQPRISSIDLPRLAAISAGVFRFCSASIVARTMLYGFDDPWLLATTLLTPITSKIARIGPPAMMPVPSGAGLSITVEA